MASERGQRKIAAILIADVVGYSRLAGADEDRTLARLRALRSDLIDPTIAVHRGRIVKRTGDGALVEFRSVVDAVRCAIEVQNGLVERNAGVPVERRIEFRVGIHLGDVVEEADGATQLKNIADPVRVYSLKVGQPAQAKPAPAPAPEKSAPPRLSMVVLPFANIGGDAEQEHFVDGVSRRASRPPTDTPRPARRSPRAARRY